MHQASVYALTLLSLVALIDARSPIRDPCANFDCDNGGTCTAPADRPYCICPSGFSGRRCEIGDICQLPKKTGRCRAYFRRWYYNSRQGKCLQFTYGGCGANANNFKSKSECENRCGGGGGLNTCNPNPCKNGGKCEAPLDAPKCICKSGYTGKYCERKVNVCQLPFGANQNPDFPIQCFAWIPQTKWSFNKRTGRCETFTWGSCGGNANRFDTFQACQRRCGGPGSACATNPCRNGGKCTTPSPFSRHYNCECKPDWKGRNCNERKPVCKQTFAKNGFDDPRIRCKPAGPPITRWSYNQRTGRCEKFRWVRCGGNQNNFKTKAACQGKCKAVSNPCKPNPCRNGGKCVRIYTFAPADKYYQCKCKPDWKGDECQKRIPVCKQSFGKNGLDDPRIQCGVIGRPQWRWSYDKKQGKCRKFKFFLCGGNQNNFKSKKACEKKCGGKNTCTLTPENAKAIAKKLYHIIMNLRQIKWNGHWGKCSEDYLRGILKKYLAKLIPCLSKYYVDKYFTMIWNEISYYGTVQESYIYLYDEDIQYLCLSSFSQIGMSMERVYVREMNHQQHQKHVYYVEETGAGDGSYYDEYPVEQYSEEYYKK